LKRWRHARHDFVSRLDSGRDVGAVVQGGPKFDHADSPFALQLDRAEWRITLDEAERLASAGHCVEYWLERVARQGVAPKAEPFFRRKIDFGDEVVTLALGIAAEPVGVYLEWAGKRVVVSLDRRDVLLIALARIGEAPPTSGERPGFGAPATSQCAMTSFVRSPPERRQHLRREPKREMGQRGNATILERAIGAATARRVK
jgi:hypothetical protein